MACIASHGKRRVFGMGAKAKSLVLLVSRDQKELTRREPFVPILNPTPEKMESYFDPNMKKPNPALEQVSGL